MKSMGLSAMIGVQSICHQGRGLSVGGLEIIYSEVGSRLMATHFNAMEFIQDTLLLSSTYL